MSTPERCQDLDIVLGVLYVDTYRLHPTAVNNEENQNVDRAVPLIIKLALLDRAGDGMPNRMPLQDLKAGLLISTDDPETALRQSLSISVAPEDFSARSLK